MLSKIFSRTLLHRNMSVFMQYPNPIIGMQTWEEKDADYDYHQEVARSAFADMLHDHERNQKYYIALKAAIEKMHKDGKEANVLDIGTGTGLLSMMAAKCGADTIVACEAFKPMATCAAKIIRENHLENKIQLIYKRSNALTVGEHGDMKKRANILVTEVFDTELIGEGALSTFRHAHQVLLEEDCIVVPSSGTVWAQVVESSLVQLWDRIQPIHDPDTHKILIDPSPLSKSCSGAAAVHDIQLSRLPRNAFTPLLPPLPIFRFDWSGKEPLIFNETKHLSTKAIASGTAHAIFMWWDLNMDTEGKVLLSCAPVWKHPDVKAGNEDSINFAKLAENVPWRDHWMQAIYYLSTEIAVKINDEVTLIGSHDEYSFWFHLSHELKSLEKYEKPVCKCCIHVAFSRTRIGQLSDKKRNDKYIKALRNKITRDSICFCISDGSLLGLAAIKLGAKKLIILETNYLSRRIIETFIKLNDLNKKVEVIDSEQKLPQSDEIDLIFGEPYFVTSLLPWDNLRFWYIIQNYPSHLARIPLSLTIYAVPVEFKDLHKIRAPLGICEGFDMTIFDKLIADSSKKSDSPVEAQPLWEYPCRALGPPFTIITFDFYQNLKNVNKSDTIQFTENGLCNGVALWVDWQLDADTVISAGPLEEIVPGNTQISWDPYVRQGVHLLRNFQQVKKGYNLDWTFKFSSTDGQLNFNFKINKSRQK